MYFVFPLESHEGFVLSVMDLGVTVFIYQYMKNGLLLFQPRSLICWTFIDIGDNFIFFSGRQKMLVKNMQIV